MESMAQAEADWNCRKCGAPIAALDEATILTTSGIPIVKIPAALIDQAREAIAKAEGK